MQLVERLRADTNNSLIPLLRSLESEYVQDAYAATLSEVFERLRESYIDVGRNAKVVASSFVSETSRVNRERFYKSIENAIGINLQTVIQKEGLEDLLIAKTSENVSLIKSIPDEYFKKIESIVYNNTTRGSKAGGIIKEIMELEQSTIKRAKLIARDQTQKLNSAMNQKRQENLGIEEYIWITSKDERVRETHKQNNGKRFRWDSPPPKTGHPGEDIQCRCVAQPIINL